MYTGKYTQGRKGIVALLLTAAWAGISFLFFYPGKTELGKAFGIASIYILTRYFALYSGIVIFLVRFILLKKINTGLLYIFIGMLNAMVGLLAIVLYILHLSVISWLHLSLLNLLLGAILLADSFFIGNHPKD